VITIADLIRLADHPEVAYDWYDELRAAARARHGGLADPRDIPRAHEVVRRRGPDWCPFVIGKPMTNGLPGISATDTNMLIVADERDFKPPVPPWLAQWKEESAATQRAQDAAGTASLERDQARWTAAKATCGVEVEVRPNVHGHRTNSTLSGPLRHVVPAVAARSKRRLHQPGLALCEKPQRSKHLELGEPTSDPATCGSCIRYTAEIGPASTTGSPDVPPHEEGQ
jgi:hypothetical protein